jgi:hypothetical protein
MRYSMTTVIPMRIDIVQGRFGLSSRRLQCKVMTWHLERYNVGACYEDVAIIIDGWADTC